VFTVQQLTVKENIMQAATLSRFAPSTHNIQRDGIGYRGILTLDELRKCVPSAFATEAHSSRSERYAYVPTSSIIDGLHDAGFVPVKALQSRTRIEDKKDFTKHMIRFRREDQLGATEAREIILKNSHDGSSAYELSAGIYRLVCSNGLCVGNDDMTFKVRHSGNAVGDVIDVASRIVDNFDLVAADIDLMKSVKLNDTYQKVLATSAIAARFEGDEKPVNTDQVLRPRRQADVANDVWTTFNRIQENLLKGGLRGVTTNAVGHTVRRKTREVSGIDQSTALNRALWTLGVEVAKLAR
jgi:hypothetical protein